MSVFAKYYYLDALCFVFWYFLRILLGSRPNGSCPRELGVQALGNAKQKNQVKTEKREVTKSRADLVELRVFPTDSYVV